MLPHNHFLIAGMAITPATMIFFPERSAREIGEWVLIGGSLSAAIDLDIVALVLLKSRKEPRLRLFRNPIEIYRQFSLFMDTIADTGVLQTGLKTHLISSLIIILSCALFAAAYFFPVFLGIVSHILSDIPNLRRISA